PLKPTVLILIYFIFFFSSRRRHTRFSRDWSSDVCSSDLSDLAMNKNVKTAGWVYTYFNIFPLSKSQNLISSLTDGDGETLNLSYSNYAVEGNLFPKTINLSGAEQGTISVTYQE